MPIIPTAIRLIMAAWYLFAGFFLLHMVVKNHRLKLDIGLFDTFVSMFISLFCLGAGAFIVTV